MEDKRLEWEREFRTALEKSVNRPEKRLNQMLAPTFVSCDYDEQSITMAYQVEEWEWNPRSELHGGAIAAMFDLSLGIAARCASMAFQIATTDMAISFLRRVDGDDTIEITVKVRKNGRQMLRLSGEACSRKTGKAVAIVQSSYMVLAHGEPVKIRQVQEEDLESLCFVENQCFPQAEAATEDSFKYRIKAFPESFYVAEQDGRIVGLINGCVTDRSSICDELYEPAGGHDPEGANQTVFGLAVLPEYQRAGIAAQLMECLIDRARAAGRKRMILTCKEGLIHYYEKFGYVNQGVSASVHGGAVWYDMVMEL